MKFVEEEISFIFEEKKSKFIAHIFPYKNFKTIMERLRVEHPKGRHFVYAYRYLNEYEQVVENSSDDGEPKGTSGKPCLNVLSGNELINTAVIIVRYFGGIKLGTGGLVRAYGDSVNAVISLSSFKEYKKLENKTLSCEYSELSKLEYLLTQENIEIIHKEFSSKVVVSISLTAVEYENLKKILPRSINYK